MKNFDFDGKELLFSTFGYCVKLPLSCWLDEGLSAATHPLTQEIYVQAGKFFLTL
jgi:hypothetical protein